MAQLAIRGGTPIRSTPFPEPVVWDERACPLTTWPRFLACTSPSAFISLKTRPHPSWLFMAAIWSRVRALVPLGGFCELYSDVAIF